MMKNDESYIGIGELETRTQLSAAYLREQAELRKIPFINANGRKRFIESDVRQALERMANTSRQRTILG